MCGFVGIVLPRSSHREIDRARLLRARDALAHRGPDDAGLFTERRVGLGHRRLTIVDLEGGRQPFASDDGMLRLVYNGEVYNHLELSRELKSRGHRYRTRCDTETVLRLYQEHGTDCVQRMQGMYAFSVWNRERESLFLARDRLGIKPLYYAHLADGALCFASEMKALLELDAVGPELNVEALPDYLANHAPSGPETLFSRIRRLPPGHTLQWRDGEIRLDRYWEPSFEPLPPEKVDANPPATFRELFTESVRMRLMADVPLGVFLSGGIDSASITGVMSELVDDPIQSFSVAFRDPEANELSFARQAAEAFGTDHHEVMDRRIDARVYRVPVRAAEMVKHACNAFHALKVSFANKIGNVCKEMAVDSHEVMELVCADRKLNISPAYLKPGFAFGGSCLPKDVRALLYEARSRDVETPVLRATMETNRQQVERAARMVLETGRRSVGVLGLSFKAGTDDLRESPMVSLVEILLGKGLDLKVYDRNVRESGLIGANREFIESQIPHIWSLMEGDLSKVVESSEVLVVGNASEEYADVEELRTGDQVVVDLARILDDGAVEEASREAWHRGICW